jgi:hypothetical protein
MVPYGRLGVERGNGVSERMGADMRAWVTSKGRERRWLAVSLLTLGLGATLAACGEAGASATQPTPISTGISAPSATPTAGGPPTPTLTPLPGAANLAGATDICTAPISVATALLPEIPAYDGQLRLAQASNGNAEYGYCVSATVDAVTAFYAAQLPAKGWQNIQTFTNSASRNIIATRGSEHLTITVSPDVVQTSNADLLIIVNGG